MDGGTFLNKYLILMCLAKKKGFAGCHSNQHEIIQLPEDFQLL